MAHKLPSRLASARGAVATGARATGAAATGALSVGAMAIGAVAVGAFAIGRLAIGRARIGRVEIGELVVHRLAIGGAVSTLIRIRAAPGQGEALERLLVELAPPSTSTLRRSVHDADSLFIEEQGEAPAPWLDTLRHRAVEEGLVENEEAIAVDVLRAIGREPVAG